MIDRLEAAAIGGRLSGGEFEEHAHIPKGSVAMLVWLGLLRKSVSNHGYLVEVADVDAFVTQYVSDLEIARTRNVSRALIREALDQRGFNPVAVLEATHRRPCAIYLRAQVERCSELGQPKSCSRRPRGQRASGGAKVAITRAGLHAP